MPIYEYICRSCRARSSVFTRTMQFPADPSCPHCGSQDLERAISSFAFHRSEGSRLEEAGPPTMSPSLDYYKDPRNIGRWTEKRLEELGMEMPAQVKEMIGKAREGEVSDLLEKKGF